VFKLLQKIRIIFFLKKDLLSVVPSIIEMVIIPFFFHFYMIAVVI